MSIYKVSVWTEEEGELIEYITERNCIEAKHVFRQITLVNQKYWNDIQCEKQEK
jgi:hypothetical protein